MSASRRPCRTRLLAAAAASALVFGGAGLGLATTASAVDPLTYAIGRSVSRFLFGTVPHRARDYERIAANRNQDLARVADVEGVRDYQHAQGQLSDAAYQREQQRLESWRQGIVARAEREKQITRHDYNHAIGNEARTMVQGAVTSLPGVDPVAGKFVSNIVGGKDPLTAALDAINDPSKPIPDRLAAVHAQLGDTQKAFESLRSHLRDPNSALKQEVDRLRENVLILSDPGTRPPPGELETRVNRLQQELRETRDSIKNAWKDLTGSTVTINNERFAKDEKWRAANANVQAIEGISDATKAALAAQMRQRLEQTEENVRKLLTDAGLGADERTVSQLAAEAIAELSRKTREAVLAGEDRNLIDREGLLRKVVNRELQAQGEEPLPEPGETVAPSASPSPGPGASPSAEATVSPSAEATEEPPTPQPPTPTPRPPTPTPEPTAAPTPEPTATPTPEPTPTPRPPTTTPTPTPTAPTGPSLPTITASGGFTDSTGVASTFSLTFDFKTGGVSGSLRGGGTDEWTAPCKDPQGNVMDIARARLTVSYTAGVAGGIGQGGGFSASYSGTAAGTIAIIEPFDVPGCVGKEPPLQQPVPTPVSGTISGTATPAGAISFTTSGGGAWSGTGAVQP